MLQAVNQKVVAVEAHVVKLRGPQAYLGAPPSVQAGYFVRPPWRSLYSDRFESLLVRVECDDGTYGWGEALAPVAPEVCKEIVDRLLAPVLLGQSPVGRVRPLWSMLSGLMRERGHLVGHQADALAAVDIALWDLTGRACGLPVHALLGGRFRDAVPTYVSGLPGNVQELAAQWAAQGVTSVKLHLGHGVAADLETYDAVAAAAAGMRIAIDAHWAYGLSDALRLGKALDERGAWFLEAPLVPEDVDGHRELAAALVTPVAVGETMRNRFEFRTWLAARAVDLCQPDVGRTGITEAMAVAEVAAAHHIPVAPHHSVGLGVALAAGLHVSAAIEDMPAFEFQPGTLPVANRVLKTPLHGGPVSFALPTSPGLGVEVDLDQLLEDA